MYRYKTLFRGRLWARGLEIHRTEARGKCAGLNRMTQLGMPKTVRGDAQGPCKGELFVKSRIMQQRRCGLTKPSSAEGESQRKGRLGSEAC